MLASGPAAGVSVAEQCLVEQHLTSTGALRELVKHAPLTHWTR
jgi:hypothetical protein